jgi:hypothetical protein
MRRAMGTAVFSGMIGVTIFGLFLTPVFFVVLMKLFPRPPRTRPPPIATSSTPGSNPAGCWPIRPSGFPHRVRCRRGFPRT